MSKMKTKKQSVAKKMTRVIAGDFGSLVSRSAKTAVKTVAKRKPSKFLVLQMFLLTCISDL